LLPKRERLANEREIKRVVREKQYESKSPLLSLAARDNPLTFSRLAVVVPKRLGSSPRRNWLRRRFFEIFAKLTPDFRINIDVVIYPRTPALAKGFGELLSELRACLNDLKIC
jgi:ribonuclease P protein component